MESPVHPCVVNYFINDTLKLAIVLVLVGSLGASKSNLTCVDNAIASVERVKAIAE